MLYSPLRDIDMVRPVLFCLFAQLCSAAADTLFMEYDILNICPATWEPAKAFDNHYVTDYLCGMARHEHGFNAFHRAGSQCQIGHLDAARAVKCDKGGGLRINLKKGEKKPVKRVVLFEESGNAATEFNPALDTADTSTITPPGLKSPIGDRFEDRLLFCSSAGNPQKCSTYSFSSNSWTPLPSLPPDTHNGMPGVVSILDTFWLVAGTHWFSHDHVNYYKDGAWHVGPSYPLNSRDLFAFAVSAFEFLACGGEDNNVGPPTAYIDKCFKMDARKQKVWEPAATMIYPCSAASVGTVTTSDGKKWVIAASGKGPSGIHRNTVMAYDIEKENWSLKEPFPGGTRSKAFMTDAGMLNKLYMFGGKDKGSGSVLSTNEILEYNADSDTWTKMDSVLAEAGPIGKMTSGAIIIN